LSIGDRTASRKCSASEIKTGGVVDERTQHESSVADDVKGAVAGFLLSIPFVILLIGLLYSFQHLALAWPAVGYLIAAAVALFLVRNSSNPWMRAAKGMLIPAVIGFAILSVLLIAMNWPTDAPRGDDVARIEHQVLWLAKSVPVSLTAGWPKLLILIILIAVIRFAPAAQLVSRYVGLATIVRRIAAGLALATSFSFFTNDAVLGERARTAEERVAVAISRLEQQQRDALGKYLAVRVLNEALKTVGTSDAKYVFTLLTEVKETPDLTTRGRLHLASELGRQIAAEAMMPVPSDAEPAELDRLEIRNRSRETLAAEMSRAEVTRRQPLPPREQVKAFEEMLTMASVEARRPLELLLNAFLDGILDQESSELSRQGRIYVRNVADRYVDGLLKPYIQAEASRFQYVLSRRASVFAERAGAFVERVVTSPRDVVGRTIVYLAVEKPKKLIDAAHGALYVAQESDLPAKTELLSIASAELVEAKGLLEEFGVAAALVARAPVKPHAHPDPERAISEAVKHNAERAKQIEQALSEAGRRIPIPGKKGTIGPRVK
jgi:hypothetical protein